jgi:DNA-binding transcriptional LysR family regulator
MDSRLAPYPAMTASKNVSLRHLRCFLEIAKTGSFTTAASRLYMTQSSLTAVIQQFEEAIGIKLFDRSTRRVALTDEAIRFKGEAESIVTRFDTSIGDLCSFAQLQQGHLRIAAAASVIEKFLTQVIGNYRTLYPHITISVRDAGAALVEKMLSSGEIDFALTSRHKGMSDLVYTPLLQDSYGVVFPPNDTLASSDGPLDWHALDPDRYIGFSADTGIGSFLRENVTHSRLFDSVRDEISSTTSLYSLLKIGGRYSIVPALAADAELPTMKFRPLKSPVLVREICLIARRMRSLSPSAEAFLNMTREVIQTTRLPRNVSLPKVAKTRVKR